MTLTLNPNQQTSLEMRFSPRSAEYPLCCAKLLLFAPGQKAFQIPLTGPTGVPEISLIQETEASQIRARNAGSAPAFLKVPGASPEILVIPPGASEAFQPPGKDQEIKVQAGPDYLRLLYDGAQGKGQWAEMAEALHVDVFQAERILNEAVHELKAVKEE